MSTLLQEPFSGRKLGLNFFWVEQELYSVTPQKFPIFKIDSKIRFRSIFISSLQFYASICQRPLYPSDPHPWAARNREELLRFRMYHIFSGVFAECYGFKFPNYWINKFVLLRTQVISLVAKQSGFFFLGAYIQLG